MESTTRFTLRAWSIGAAALALLMLLSVSLWGTAPTNAQELPPTPANDPLWRAFREVRTALEDKYNLDLTIVTNWEWTQIEFAGNGIDSCVDLDDPNSARPLYFGWQFTIIGLNGQTYEGRSSFDATIVAACDRVTAAVAPTAAPGAPAANPNLPPPVAGSAAVGSFELGGHVFELNGNTVAVMRRAGMVWVKKQIRYNAGDSAAGVAGEIQQAKSNGFKVLVAVVGQPSQMGNFDSYVAGFATFLGEVAALGPDAIEVWNEPNIDREWPAGQINGANYTRMLAAAFNAIKSRNPNVIVISGAPAPTGFFGAAGCTAQGCNDDAFMQQMAQAGAAQYMDCVGLHYNEGIIPPTQASGDPRGGYPTYYFGSMLARGYNPFGGKPVCFTELGYLSGEGFSTPIPASFAWAQNTTVAQHAAWLAQAAQQAAASGRVRLMIVWNVDFPFYTASDPMGGYGIVRPGGACPACDTLGTVMRR